MISGNRDTVYFVSDAHFGLYADERAKITRFAELASEMRERAADVYLVGDMFDFWVEYKSAIRRDYFPVLHTLRGLVEAGVRLHYVAGNHDFALGTFLEETIGISVHRDGVDAELQGRRVHINHGDRMQKGGFLGIAGALLRNRRLQAIYKLMHPNIGVALGRAFSAASRKRYSNLVTPPKVIKMFRRAAEAKIKAGACDLTIFAHTHHADLVNFEGGDYCNTGSWMDNHDYAVLQDGRIQLMRWGNGSDDNQFKSGNSTS